MSTRPSRYGLVEGFVQQFAFLKRVSTTRKLHDGVQLKSCHRVAAALTPRSLPYFTIFFAQDSLMSSEQSRPDDPVFPYTQLWASKDGETHIQECFMKEFDFKKYASASQFVKDGGKPLRTVFTVWR